VNRSALLARLGIAGALFLAATVAVLHLVQPELDPISHFVSEYAHGPLGWLLMIGYVVAGAGALALAWSLHGQSTGRRALITAVCMVLVSIGLVATGLTRIDVAQVDGAMESTISGQLHGLAGYVVVLGLIPAAFLVSGAVHRDGGPVSRAGAMRSLPWAILAGFVVAVLSQSLDATGLGQRIFLATWLSWLVLLGVVLSRGADRLSSLEVA